MTRLLFCSLLTAWSVTACWAAAAIDPKVHSINVDSVRTDNKQRQGHALRSDTASYSSYLTAPAPPVPAPLAPAPSAPVPSSSLLPSHHPMPISYGGNPADTTMGYVYYYLPTVEKYYPKLRDLVPYMRRSWGPIASRASSVLHQATDRTFDLGAAVSLVLLAPALLISSMFFLVFIVFLLAYPAVAAFGKRRMGRDLSGMDDPDQTFDFDKFLPPEESRKLATLAARVEEYLETYKKALKSDPCLEKFSCEAGQLTSRLGNIPESFLT